MMKVLKAENISSLGSERCNMQWPLEAGSGRQLTASKNVTTWPSHLKGQNPVNILNEIETDPLLMPPSKKGSPVNTLILTRWDLKQRTQRSHWASDPQNQKRINGHCSKPLKLWLFATAATEN